MTAAAIKKQYPNLGMVNTNTLNSALTSIRKAFNNAVTDRKKGSGEGSKFTLSILL